MITVFGATGNIGRPLVEQLAKAGQKLRVSTRDASKSFPAGVEKIVGEFDDKTIGQMVKGAEKLFLLVPPSAAPATEEQILKAAKAAGVKYVVKLSTIGASGEKPQALGVHHRQMEQALEASGMAWTMLRPGFFMSNVLAWLPQVRATGAVRNMYGEGLMYPIAPEDIAAVGAVALTSTSYQGKYLELTGEHPITVSKQVETMSRIWNKPVKIVDVSPEEGAAEAMKNGTPERVASALKELWTATRANKASFHTTVAREIVGRPLMTFEQWCEKNLPKL
jgi:uncharacterized protein YbjT (DUF2867 family)